MRKNMKRLLVMIIALAMFISNISVFGEETYTGDVLGANVIDYARSFIGKVPYVYGGTSLERVLIVLHLFVVYMNILE